MRHALLAATILCLGGMLFEPASRPPVPVSAAAPAAPEPNAEVKFFRQKIEPVLRDHCYECHSRDAEELKGELRLDTREGRLKGGPNGPAVVPGDISASFLMRALRYTEDDYKMPPRGRLDDAVLQDFETWIKRGAIDGEK